MRLAFWVLCVKSGQTDPLFFIESDLLLFGGYCPPFCGSFSEQTDPPKDYFWLMIG